MRIQDELMNKKSLAVYVRYSSSTISNLEKLLHSNVVMSVKYRCIPDADPGKWSRPIPPQLTSANMLYTNANYPFPVTFETLWDI